MTLIDAPLDSLPDSAREALREREMPSSVKPMPATLTDSRFSDPDWIYERKLDGECCIGLIERETPPFGGEEHSGRGTHWVTPKLVPAAGDFSPVRDAARRVRDVLEQLQLTPFLDTARNAYGQTTVAPYSVRARPGAPIAVPVDWDELSDSDLTASRYTLENVFRRLAQKEDPWRAIARHAPKLATGRARWAQLRADG